MKKLLTIASIGALALTALLVVQCDELLGGAPTNIQIAAATDSTIQVTWSAPTEGTPDNYRISFMEVGASGYTMVAETSATAYVHNPMGVTGRYKVEAVFGSETYAGATTPTTVPVANAATKVAELNAAGNSGYGWDMVTGEYATYSMIEASNAPLVDLYVTDFAVGSAGPQYSIASPDVGPSDPGNVVPTATWRVNGFTDPLSGEDGPLPSHSPVLYFNYTDLVQTPMIVGCYTEDGYYAMVRVNSVNTGSGEVELLSWFQLVEGLRLIKH